MRYINPDIGITVDTIKELSKLFSFCEVSPGKFSEYSKLTIIHDNNGLEQHVIIEIGEYEAEIEIVFSKDYEKIKRFIDKFLEGKIISFIFENEHPPIGCLAVKYKPGMTDSIYPIMYLPDYYSSLYLNHYTDGECDCEKYRDEIGNITLSNPITLWFLVNKSIMLNNNHILADKFMEFSEELNELNETEGISRYHICMFLSILN